MQTDQERAFARLLSRQFSSLASYNYRLFFFGQVISLVGSAMQTTGQAWLVLRMTGSPAALGVVVTLQYLPVTLLSLVGGALADRLPKRPTIMTVLSVATGQAIILSALVLTGVVQVWHVYALALLLGVTNAIERPIRQTFFVELVGRDRLVNAVALNSTILNASQVLGPAIGGVLIAVAGVESTFVINALSFIAVLLAYALMRPALFHAPKEPPQSAGLVRDIRAGLRYSFGTPPVTYILLLVLFVSLFGYGFGVTIPLIAKYTLHAGAAQFGLLSACLGAGSLIAAFAIAGMSLRSSRVILWSSLSFVGLLGALSLSRWYLPTALILVGLGLAAMALFTVANTTLQLTAPPQLRGRVISVYVMLQTGVTPICGVMTGILAEHAGIRPAIAIQAALCAAGIGVAVAYRVAKSGSAALPFADPALVEG